MNLSTHQIFFFKSLDSTNNYGRDILPFAEFPLVIVADLQTAGRGQRGNKWLSEGSGVYMSVVVPKFVDDFPPTAKVSKIAYVVAVAVGHSVVEFFTNFLGRSFNTKQDYLRDIWAGNLFYKWPNDIILGGKKIGGILIENYPEGMVIGIGVNVGKIPPIDNNPQILPGSVGGFFADHLKNFNEEGKSFIQENFYVIREGLIDQVMCNLTKYMEIWQKYGFAEIRKIWLKGAWGIGKNYTSRDGVSGILHGIDMDGMVEILTNGYGPKNFCFCKICRKYPDYILLKKFN